jgi:hypothetical protein
LYSQDFSLPDLSQQTHHLNHHVPQPRKDFIDDRLTVDMNDLNIGRDEKLNFKESQFRDVLEEVCVLREANIIGRH